ncbi:uncharacterized protein [Pituophis catenifer annectens]|uniref:uncharacterized protein n=1 Tax=Pituophis catenifer annectens TaxID=94852 RepID=UPI003994DD64
MVGQPGPKQTGIAVQKDTTVVFTRLVNVKLSCSLGLARYIRFKNNPPFWIPNEARLVLGTSLSSTSDLSHHALDRFNPGSFGFRCQLLTLRNHPHSSIPTYPRLGKPVLLFLDDNRAPTTCNWFRGRDTSEESHIFRADFDSTEGVHRINQTGAAYTGREDLARGCSLIIRKVRPSDAGPYTVSMMGLGGSGAVTGVRNLQVYYSPFSFHPEGSRVVQFPPNPRVGQSVYLYLDDIQNPSECSWFRGKEQREEGRIFSAKFSGNQQILSH